MKLLDTAIKGFNAGYLIEKFNPQLSKSLSTGIKDTDNPFVLGFLLGRIKLIREMEREQSETLKVDYDIERRVDGLELE